MKLIRWVLGRLVLLINALTLPAKGQRNSELQASIELELVGYSMYQFTACPFCVKARRHLRRLNLPMELRDAMHDEMHRQDLLMQGGKIQVPCLRIESKDGSSEWMYESSDIAVFLSKQFPLI